MSEPSGGSTTTTANQCASGCAYGSTTITFHLACPSKPDGTTNYYATVLLKFNQPSPGLGGGFNHPNSHQCPQYHQYPTHSSYPKEHINQMFQIPILPVSSINNINSLHPVPIYTYYQSLRLNNPNLNPFPSNSNPDTNVSSTVSQLPISLLNSVSASFIINARL